MRRGTSSTVRAFVGTMVMFVVLLIGTFVVILLEHYLENFKSH
ncbi:MAG: hypothetical protein JWL78_353 [Chloroflexi bacterium]|jgi:hypothetical protein|nr:hypothetical protein [Chloroflexota bacterium]MEA2616247.1 hypothetical protein [Chloroflexota bacterium]